MQFMNHKKGSIATMVGKEGRTLEFCKQQKIRPIYLRRYHLQSQEKVERSHRESRAKILPFYIFYKVNDKTFKIQLYFDSSKSSRDWPYISIY